MTRSRGFTLIELMIVIAIIAIIAAIAIPSILEATRAANERNASGSLKQFGSIQTVFKSSDSDQNLINDYYTADVKGLYFISVGSPTSPIRMIEISVATADCDPDASNGGYTNPSTPVHSPKAGYWYRVLVDYEQAGTSETAYGYRNYDRFGYIALPNAYGSSGRNVFILNEGGTMFKRDPGSLSAVIGATSISSGVNDPNVVLDENYDHFPLDPFAAGWNKLD